VRVSEESSLSLSLLDAIAATKRSALFSQRGGSAVLLHCPLTFVCVLYVLFNLFRSLLLTQDLWPHANTQTYTSANKGEFMPLFGSVWVRVEALTVIWRQKKRWLIHCETFFCRKK